MYYHSWTNIPRLIVKFNDISNDFMVTLIWSNVCDVPIHRIDLMEHSQPGIHQLYDDLCSHVFE